MSFCRKSLFSVSSTSASLSSSAGKAAGGTPEPNAARLAAGTEAHPRAVLSFASEESDAKGTVFSLRVAVNPRGARLRESKTT
jgi:hypothetical protein